jgi:hypothetical protein
MALAKKEDSVVGNHSIILGDGRTLKAGGASIASPESVGLMLYSPPYLNHIDYTEVYKVELWLLKFVLKQAEMLSLRRQTFRSHASVLFDDANENLPGEVSESIDVASQLVESSKSKWHKRFRPAAVGYATDLQRSLRRQFELLQPGCRAICIIGNSAHGRTLPNATVAADLWLSSIARTIGFEVERVITTRRIRRRGEPSELLRESAVIMRKA